MPFVLPDPHTTLRLHLNENTSGCSPAVLAAIRSIDALEAATYPNAAPATTAAERYFGVEPGWVQLTDGLDDGLRVAAEVARAAAAGDRGVAVIVDPTFEMYEIYIAGVGLEIAKVATGADFEFPLDGVMDALSPRTRLVYLADPNNPTGQPIPDGAIQKIVEAAPDAVVLVDEAYSEFSGRSIIGPMLDRHRNLIVGRTFAKAFGLAGLRVGALVARPETLAPMRRGLPPFSVNVCALRALEAALADRAHVQAYIEQTDASRHAIYDFCRRHGLRYWPSETNFVLVRLGERAPLVMQAVAARGILISGRSHQFGCAGTVRITAGVLEHTKRLLDELERVLGTT
ncbi:MAG TPA: aminotransferase class I/II-fold pyridoxal phosphate-dependent enzyme [Vicinamibacterales bacterium]|nr:aminotransferase class I/II-fold pyridoxal phosphate-dependent enzyme [Vicinamibacterales bacterium]